jgi:hypothetical protein
MKARNFLMFTLAVGLIAGASAFKVNVCHNVDHNPVTINIAIPAMISHLIQHPEDSLGLCKTNIDEPGEIQK